MGLNSIPSPRAKHRDSLTLKAPICHREDKGENPFLDKLKVKQNLQLLKDLNE